MEIDVQESQPRRRLEFEEDEDFIQSNLDGEEDEDLIQSYLDGETIESLHSKIPDEIIPRVGMEFQTEDNAYKFYNAYALAVGFSVRRSGTHKCKGIVVDRTFVCSAQGKRKPDKRDNVYKSHRVETRFDCLAMLKISCRQTGSRYCVVNFVAQHSHNMASPSKAHLFRSHRRISASQASQVDMADNSGIAPKNTYEFMARQAGGREHLGFSHVDIKNYLRSKRTVQMKQHETGGVLEYLQRMRVEDPNFFYAIQVDEDDLITNIFWADARMMADYEDFGDVICFDTTYRKHKDGRPIALFVGVNHHKQSIIFGVALLYDETAETFVWLFDTFSRAMGGKLPQTMLTDQDAAMSKALASQWPETYHRLCIWHIFQNAANHLAGVFAKYKDFSRSFSNCIYDYEHEEEFLDAWNEMLEKYGLQDNEWLKRLFNIKEKWALVYGRDTFCADMTTTQRSESMNNLIKHYVSYKHNLQRFFEHFQRLLNDRRYDEMVADFKASQSKVSSSIPVEMLRHAASVYTPAVFVLFQEEIGKAFDCHLEVRDELGTLLTYVVTPHKKHYSHIVSYYGEIDESIFCTCRKFEFSGLLCSHILKVLSFRGITEVPSKYILKRWTKDAKSGSIRVSSESLSDEINPKDLMGRRYRDLCGLSTRLVTRAAEIEDKYTRVKEGLLNLMREVGLGSTEKPLQSNLEDHLTGNDQNLDKPVNANGMMKNIRGIKLKPKPGSRSSKRPESALQKATKKKRRPKPSPSTNNDLGNQNIQLDRSAPQESIDFIHPWDTLGYNNSTSSNYGLGDMHTSSLPPAHPSEQVPSSYMALLNSIGMPQVQPK